MRGRNRAFLTAAMVLGATGASRAAQQPANSPASKQTVKADRSEKVDRTDQKIDYLIGPADLLQIFVWKEPELSRDVNVRLDGKITVPLLGDVEAAGRTPQQLGEELAKSLSKFLETPRVTVGVSQANSTRFYVVGQVGRPGDFPLSGRTTVLQGLALAGGFRDFAKTDSIVIVRQDRNGQVVIPVNYKKLEDGKDISQNITLRPGDTVIVP
jgi:polysaccharide export outer membrane protein